MTDREREILNILKTDPMISQQELADKLCITRSSIAVHITNLMKKGYIKGKGYILSSGSYITVIGGSNMDIQGIPKKELVMFDSNPGKVDISLGGVGRNIADNISRLGIKTKLISAIGNDLYGNKILSECRKFGMDVDDCFISNEHSTSIYVSILNGDNDMQVAISHMDILDKLDVDYISSKHQAIGESLAIVIDTNLSEDVIDYVTTNYSNIPIFVDTVSTSKCMKIKEIVGRFHTIKVNKYEAEALSNIKINSIDNLKQCSEYFLGKGVKNIFITLGKDGVFCANKKESMHIKGATVNIVSATGAGDAFTAGLVYSYLNNFELEYSTKFSMAASIVALSHENTINPNMSVDNVDKILKEMILC
ncbi:winged helix-turn-helix transcriptional regulator [Romboutsia weinsteinii]|uniref:Winged helix-turn-helix transcriptional regulator n=1 Tax=Romboutsia weinsteinii TaxID=2020949 RepID=A0A371J087_9FIRM|nr:PfkB family carbohydrate kinase [Romboutsia weinsteinii]RDY26179.1 winged helix-turn-helix transcriptional regulator [Romboutsia weinsteinii]